MARLWLEQMESSITLSVSYVGNGRSKLQTINIGTAPPIIVGSGRPALQENPSSGDLPAVRQRRHSDLAPGHGGSPRMFRRPTEESHECISRITARP